VSDPRVRPLRLGYLAAAAVTVYGAATGRDKLQWLAKPLLMPLLAADVVTSGVDIEPTERTMLLASLGAATVGDVLLIDPDDDRRLVAGASAFAVMQAGYAGLWWRRGARPGKAITVQRVAAWLGAAVLMQVKTPTIATPLTAYGATLATAGVLASDPELAPEAAIIGGLNVPDADPRSRLALGSLLFTLSDGLIILRRVFARSTRAGRGTEAVILGTYAAAQYLLTDPRAHARTH